VVSAGIWHGPGPNRVPIADAVSNGNGEQWVAQPERRLKALVVQAVHPDNSERLSSPSIRMPADAAGEAFDEGEQVARLDDACRQQPARLGALHIAMDCPDRGQDAAVSERTTTLMPLRYTKRETPTSQCPVLNTRGDRRDSITVLQEPVDAGQPVERVSGGASCASSSTETRFPDANWRLMTGQIVRLKSPAASLFQ
jgi:hypothetical protein